jgi:hypothetical protein
MYVVQRDGAEDGDVVVQRVGFDRDGQCGVSIGGSGHGEVDVYRGKKVGSQRGEV